MSGASQLSVAVIAAGSGGEMHARGFQELRHVDAVYWTLITDGGGSSKLFRTTYGSPDLGGFGDMRRQASALMPDRVMAAAMERRENNGPYAGLPAGNFVIYQLAKVLGNDLDKAMHAYCQAHATRSMVYPISLNAAHVQGQWSNGHRFSTEESIDHPGENGGNRIVEIELSQPVYINPRFAQELMANRYDAIVIGPGSLFGSTVPALMTTGLCEALDQTDAPIVYIPNLATVPGETVGMTIRDHIDTVNRCLGDHDIDVVIVNTGRPDEEMLSRYASGGQEFLLPREREFEGLSCDVICDSFIYRDPEQHARHHNLRVAIEVLEVARAYRRIREAQHSD